MGRNNTIGTYIDIVNQYNGDKQVITNMMIACGCHDVEYKTSFVDELGKYVKDKYNYEW